MPNGACVAASVNLDAPASLASAPGRLPQRSGGSGPSGHDKSELGPAAWRPADADRAAVGLDQALDDVQAQAGAATMPAMAAAAAGLAPPELAEHARGDLGRDALALVAHGDGGRGRVVHEGRLDHDRHDTSAVPDRV